MDAASLSKLVTELFTAIQLVSNYGLPERLPEVQIVPQQVIQEKFCNGPCRIRAVYHPEWGVFIEDKLEIERSVYDRSVLVHELVHHLQNTAGSYDPNADECARATRDEREAYEIQNRYLASVNDTRRFPLPRLTPACRG